MHDKHYSDAELVAFIDAEISPREADEITSHLELCAACQQRFVLLRYELQGAVDQVQRLQPSPGWRERTRRNLAAYEECFERERREETHRWPWLRPALALLAAAGVIVAVVSIKIPRTPPPVVAPAVTLARLNALEASLSRAKVHQTFHVRTRQIKPAGASHEGSLDVWSDGESGRFVSKWTTSAGVLKHALWQPGKSGSYTYGSQRSKHSSAEPPEAELLDGKPTVEQFEKCLMHWLEKRPWKPIVLLPDLSLWERQGERIQVERVSATELRLTARRQLHDATLEFTAFLENGDDGPKVQVLRFASAQGVVEMSLAADRLERVSGIPPGMFSPDHAVAYVQRETDLTPAQPALAPRSPEDGERVSREIEILYALHDAGACLGHAVTVTQNDSGVLVAALGATPDLAKSSLVTSSGPADVMAILADIRSAQRRQTAPDEDAVAEPERRLLHEVLDHASALELLAEKVPDERMTGLSARAKRQAGQMLADHTHALEQKLGSLAKSAPPIGAGGPRRTRPPGHSWQSLARDVSREVALAVSSKAWLPPDGASRLATLASRAQALAELSRGEFETAASPPGPNAAH